MAPAKKATAAIIQSLGCMRLMKSTCLLLTSVLRIQYTLSAVRASLRFPCGSKSCYSGVQPSGSMLGNPGRPNGSSDFHKV